jgi:hypothetical protein
VQEKHNIFQQVGKIKVIFPTSWKIIPTPWKKTKDRESQF